MARSRTRRITLLALAIAGAAAVAFALGSFVVATRIDADALRVSSSGRAVPSAVDIGEATAEVVRYATSGGQFPAWWVPGEKDTVVIAVHGRGADIHQTIPALEVAAAEGYPSMAIRYRNDPGTLITPGRRASFGDHEWRDLDAAARFALRRGASNVVIVGYSMGAAIGLNFMRESAMASRVTGMVLDSPALSLEETVDYRVSRVVPGEVVGVPQALSWGAKRIAARRYDIDWDAIDFRNQPLSADVPILIFHGTKDRTIPIEQSEELAERYPRLVTLERLEGAGHEEAADFDRLRHDRALRALLARATSARS